MKHQDIFHQTPAKAICSQLIQVGMIQPVQVAVSQLQLDNNVKAKILCQLSRFDDLPGSAFVRFPVVLGLFPCSKATFWRWVKAGKVPAPLKFGKISAWKVATLRLALESIEASGKSASITDLSTKGDHND